MEDGISGGLQYHYETCCEKGSRCGRWACMVQRWFHHRDVISRQMDLYITSYHYLVGYLLKHKEEVGAVVRDVVAMLERQSSKCMKHF